MADEHFHEFHLDGKQMVFLFMASTVVAVVIFLCGVMVGRGVRANKNADTVAATASELVDQIAAAQTTDALETGVPTTTTTVPSDDSSGSRPAKPAESAAAIAERPRAGDVRGPVVDRAPEPASQEPSRAAVKESPSATVPLAFREPAGPGFAVQVMAVPRFTDAEAAARKLSAKGYSSFVSPTGDGKPVYRVRVGKFKTRKAADAARNRLEKVEKYRKAWVAVR